MFFKAVLVDNNKRYSLLIDNIHYRKTYSPDYWTGEYIFLYEDPNEIAHILIVNEIISLAKMYHLTEVELWTANAFCVRHLGTNSAYIPALRCMGEHYNASQEAIHQVLINNFYGSILDQIEPIDGWFTSYKDRAIALQARLNKRLFVYREGVIKWDTIYENHKN
jgi:hypothetical protein